MQGPDIKGMLLALADRRVTVEATPEKLLLQGNVQALSSVQKAQLKTHKAEIISYILARKRVTDTVIARRTSDDNLPLSFNQSRLWFIDQLGQGNNKGSSQYNMPLALALEGELNVQALQSSFDAILMRHEVLRTVYAADGKGNPVQIVTTVRPLPLRRIDISDRTDKAECLQELIATEAVATFDLRCDLMMRATLVKLAGREHVLMVTLHHIACDGWSVGVLITEFIALYRAFSAARPDPLPPLSLQYADFALWQHKRIDAGTLQRQVDYWQDRLRDAPKLHSLPLDRPRPQEMQFAGGMHRQAIGVTLCESLRQLAGIHEATLFMVLHAALAVLLGRFSGRDDVVLSCPVAGRTEKQVEPLIGFFVNALPLRTRIDAQDTFVELLARVRRDALAAYEHQDVPFEQLVDALQPQRSLSHAPLAQIAFSLQNHARPDIVLPGLRIKTLQGTQPQLKHDLEIVATEHGGLDIDWIYATSLFDGVTLARMASGFEKLLLDVVVNPALPIAQLRVLSADDELWLAQRRQLQAAMPAAAAFMPVPYVEPQGEHERTLADIWSELLEVERVGRHDDFFALGGNSLTAVRLEFAILDRCDASIPVRELFKHPELAAQAALIAAQETQTGDAIARADRNRPLPLSFAQQRLWFIDQFEGHGSIQYNMPHALRLKGMLNRAALENALDAIVQRHEILRTNYVSQGDTAVQVVRESAATKPRCIDLKHLAGPVQADEVRSLVAEDAGKPFDLATDLLLRATLLELAADEHVLVLNQHHIASDGWSVGILVEELCAGYAAFDQGRAPSFDPLSIQYADYASWQNEVQRQRLEEHLQFWREELRGLPTLHNLPLDRARPPVATFASGHHRQLLDNELKAGLNRLARSAQASLFMLLNAAFACLLSRLSGERDIVVGSPVANRDHPQLAPLVGCFVNTLVLRTQLDHEKTFRELLLQTRDRLLRAYEHQQMPFEKLVDELQPRRSSSHHPLFQVMLILQNNVRRDFELTGLTVQALEQPAARSEFDLTLSVEETRDGLCLDWVYAAELFAGIERMAGYFEVLLRAVAANPDASIGRLPLMTSDQRARLLQCDASASFTAASSCIHARFERQVSVRPHAVAVVHAGQTLTYTQLNARANRIAHYLGERGVQPDDLVGLYAERSFACIAGVLGILKAGGAYVPLDPAYPQHRLQYMLQDAGVRHVLTQASLLANVPDSMAHVLDLDDTAALASYPDTNPDPAGLTPQHLAYVIYTSGSTGQPKGVMIEHAGVSAYYDASNLVYHVTPADAVLQFSSVSFDIFVEEFTTALLSGARLVLRNEAILAGGETFWEFIREQGITVMAFTAEFWHLLCRQLPAGSLATGELRLLTVGGEAMSPTLLERWRQSVPSQVRLLNVYGPTEATAVASYFDVANQQGVAESVPIGRPFANHRCLVLDENLELCPEGASGELYLCGASIARGYLNRPQETARSFVRSPCIAGERLYKTGDIVRHLPDGNLRYLGRVDDQVKLRGFRIEPGEIQRRLSEIAGVESALVLIVGSGENRQLVAYLVCDPMPANAAEFSRRMRRTLSAQMPAYMIPAAFVPMTSFPLTVNGKIDKDKLPQPDFSQQHAYVPAATETQRRLVAIWQELLPVAVIGIQTSFFELGGHSLLAAGLVNRLRAVFGVAIGIRDVFDHQTVQSLSAFIENAPRQSVEPIPQVDRSGVLPLSHSQRRLWFIDRLEGRGDLYNMPAALELSGTLNLQSLRYALNTIVQRHEILRTVYAADERGQPCQVINACSDIELPEVDLSAYEVKARDAQLVKLAHSQAGARFDLSADSMLRVCLVHLAPDRWMLLFNMHHIASDGRSLGILADEFARLYADHVAGKDSRLDPLPVQYADYAAWQADRLQGEYLQRLLDYWQRQLAGAPRLHSLPIDRPRPARQTFAGARLQRCIPAGLTTRLNELAAANDVTLFMLLYAAFALWIGRWSRTENVVIGTPVAGRDHVHLAAPIGFFVNMLALRMDLSAAASFDALLVQARRSALGAYEHQELSFETLVDALQVDRSLSHAPVVQVVLALQGNEGAELRLPGLRVEPVAQYGEGSRFDLTLNAVLAGNELGLDWEYATGLFDAASMERMAASFEMLLADVVARPGVALEEVRVLSMADEEWLAQRQPLQSSEHAAERVQQVLYRAPQTAVELRLAAVWQELLRVERVGLDDNFFALGGSSLTSVRLEFAILEHFDVNVSVRDLFEHPQLRAQAQFIAAQSAQSAASIEAIAVPDRERPWPLSFAQQRLWFIDQFAGNDSSQYNVPFALQLTGRLDVRALQRALDEIVQRHAILRTVYATDEEGTAYQFVLPAATLQLIQTDLASFAEPGKSTELESILAADAHAPFALSRDVMLRARLVKLDASTRVLMLNMHHIASDGWSIGIIVNELMQFYGAFKDNRPASLPQLPVQYADYAAWQRSPERQLVFAKQLAYWRRKLEGIPQLHGLPTDRPRSAQQSSAGAVHRCSLEKTLLDRLNALASQAGATLFMAMQAAFAILVGRCSRESDVVVGTPISGRTHVQVAPLVGFFVNTLVLRNDLSGNPAFSEFLRRVTANTLEAFDNQDVPFEMLVEHLGVQRCLDHAPLFQVLFTLQNDDMPPLELPELKVTSLPIEVRTAKFDLSLHIGAGEAGGHASWEYSSGLFGAGTIARLAEHYVLLLEEIVRTPERPILELPLLTATDLALYRTQAAVFENRRRRISQRHVCLHHLFEQQARCRPDAPAALFEADRISYSELNERANRLARYLRSRGVRAESRVGLCMERSIDLLVGLLGILKAGAAYVPLDPAYPRDRIAYMAEDAGLRIIVTQRRFETHYLPAGIERFSLDAVAGQEALQRCGGMDLTAQESEVTADSAAYVIYTSGSTGKPKGVLIEHANVLSLFDGCLAHFQFDESDCWTLFHSFAFDFSVWEIWGALLFGGRLVIVPYEVSRSTVDFHRLLVEQQVTVLNQTPSAFYPLAEGILRQTQPLALRYVVFGGEALEPQRLAAWMAHFGDRKPALVNMYGITETTVHVTFRRLCEQDSRRPASVIGRPLEHLTAYVCNERNLLQPVGVFGELYVGGEGVARGYLNRPQLSEQRFLSNEFAAAPARLYRTGDLARWTQDGELEYFGRIDHQAKLRGFRIELGEIEHELAATGLVKETRVLIKEHDGDRQLVAFIVPMHGKSDLAAELRRRLSATLPDYMLPSSYVFVDSMPLTTNGKADRNRLLQQATLAVASAEYIAPGNELERTLCEVWAEVLQLARVGVNDNFFAIGGDSIRVVKIVRKAEQRQVHLQVKDVFAHQTVSRLAAYYGANLTNAAGRKPAPLHLLEHPDLRQYLDEQVEDCFVVSRLQKLMLDKHGSAAGVYQPQIVFEMTGRELSVPRLQQVLNYLLHKHPNLRTRFMPIPGGYLQKIYRHAPLELPVTDLTALGVEARRAALDDVIAADLQSPFQFGAPCIRFNLLKFSTQCWGLFVSTHHAIEDGWGFVELMNELLSLYDRLERGDRLPAFDKPPHVFKEHVALELEVRTCIEHERAWRELLSGYRPMPTLSLLDGPDFDEPATIRAELPQALTAGLKMHAQHLAVPLKALLLLAYRRALQQLLNLESLTVEVVSSGRSSRLSDPLHALGLFWNLLPVCHDGEDGDDERAIQTIAQRLVAADAHSLYPIDLIQDIAGTQVVSFAAFNFVNFHNQQSAADSSEVQIRALHSSDRFHHPLQLAMALERDHCLVAKLDYDRRYFHARDMRRLMSDIEAQLGRLRAGGVS